MAEADVATDDETPTRALDDDGLYARLKAWFQADWDFHREWLQGKDPDVDGGAEEDFDFVAGKQWKESDLEILRDQNRPPTVFNRVGPMVDSVTGFEIGNRQEVRYIPRQLGMAGVNELLTQAGMWFRDQSDAEDADSDAFRNAVICGRGATETRIDYEIDPDGQPVVESLDPKEVAPNREARGVNYSDARRIWRVRRMSRDEAVSLFPDVEPEMLHANWAHEDDVALNVSTPVEDYDQDDVTSHKTDEIAIVECQWWEREPFVRFVDGATGEEVTLPQAEFEALVERMTALGPEGMMMLGVAPPRQQIVQFKRVYRRAFLGSEVLEVGPTPIDGEFSYKFITGKRDNNSGHFYGLVRPMKDPQRWVNKLFSQIMHILNSNAKGGILAERGAFEDEKQAMEDWSKAESVIWLEDGALSNPNKPKIMPKPMTPFPDGQANMLQFAMGAMPMVTGVNMEMLGMAEVQQAGILEYQRKQAGLTILQTIFGALKKYRKDQGRLMLRMIQEFLSDGRLVRIVEENVEQYIPLVREATLGDYEVIVDDAPNAPNMKERNWATLKELMPLMGPALTPELVAEIVRYSPLPESVAEMMREQIAKPPPPPSPEEEMAKRLQLAKMVAEIDQDAASAESDRAHAIERQANAVEARADAMKAMREVSMMGMGGIPPFQPVSDFPPAPVPSGPTPAGIPRGAMTPPAMIPPPQRPPMARPMPPQAQRPMTPRGPAMGGNPLLG